MTTPVPPGGIPITAFGKRKRDDQPPPRRSDRLGKKAKEALAIPPTLTVTTAAEGVATQVLDQAQNIGFHMVVRLTTAPGAGSITSLYTLQQYVRDAYNRGGADVQELTDWATDGPFGPPHDSGDGGEDGNVTVTQNVIQFDDHPGFSTTSQIDADQWLHSYQVDFRWVVTRLTDGLRWTSPEVSYRVTSVRNGDAPVPVTYTVGADQEWDVPFD